MCSWVHSYDVSTSDFKTVVRTFCSVFPQACMWQSGTYDFLLVGAKGPMQFDYGRAKRLWQQPRVKKDMASAGLHAVADVLVELMLGPAEMETFSRGAALNTDDSARLEFSAPRAVRREKAEPPFALAFEAGKQQWPIPVVVAEGSPSEADEVQTAHRVRSLLTKARWLAATGARKEALRVHEQVLALSPRNRTAREALVTVAVSEGERLLARGEAEPALAALERALRISPDDVTAMKRLGLALFQLGRDDDATATYRRVLRLAPQDGVARIEFANVLMGLGKTAQAIDVLRKLVAQYPSFVDAHGVLSVALYRAGRGEEAQQAWERVLELRPGHPPLFGQPGKKLPRWPT